MNVVNAYKRDHNFKFTNKSKYYGALLLNIMLVSWSTNCSVVLLEWKKLKSNFFDMALPNSW